MNAIFAFLLVIFTVIPVIAADVKISDLPLGTAATTGASDPFPYVVNSTKVTKKMNLWDLANIPSIVSTYAPLLSPVFTGTVTVPNLIDSGLTASQTVVTDGSKQLASMAYASAATASTFVTRNANANSFANNWIPNQTSVTSAAGTTTLTVSSSPRQILTGSTTQTFKLPDSTTLATGWPFWFVNNSTGILTVKDNGSNTLFTVPAGGGVALWPTSVGTANGVWDYRFSAPTNASFGTAGLSVTGTSSASGQFLSSDGTVGAPGLSFTNQVDSGLYRVGSNEIGLSIVGAQALDFKTSSGSLGNVGLGGAASTSDLFPLLMQRTNSSAINVQLTNPSTAAGSGAKYQVLSDNTTNTMEISTFASATITPDIYNGGAGVVRFTGSGTSTDMVLVSDVAAGSKIRLYAGGDAVGNKVGVFSSSGLRLPTLTTAGPVKTDSSGNLTSEAQLGLARGGTNADLSATGGTSQVLKQVSSGAAVTVARLACSDLSNSSASCSTDATVATNISSGTLPAGRMPALTGDITTSAGAVATTLATVNSNVGTFGDSTHVSQVTVNGKGLVTAASSVSISGTTLNVQSKTANYTALITDDIILGNTNAFTVTLYAASTATKPLRICKVGSDTNFITIARAGSDTIAVNGSTVTSTVLVRGGECLTLTSDGSSKFYLDSDIRTLSAKIACTASPSITSQTGAWISSIAQNATGDCTLTLGTGVFASSPVCVYSASANNTGVVFGNQTTVASATSVEFIFTYTSGVSVTATTSTAFVVCTGPR